MAEQIPNNQQNAVTFGYGSDEFTLTSPRYNPRALSYSVDITWNDTGIYGILVGGGVDMLHNFPECPLPNLWAFNPTNYALDLTPDSIASVMFVIR